MALSQWCKRATHVWPAPSWLCSVQWMLLELRASALCIGPWSCLGYLCNTGLIGMLVSGRHMPSQSLQSGNTFPSVSCRWAKGAGQEACSSG